jgi:hypothetical protein
VIEIAEWIMKLTEHVGDKERHFRKYCWMYIAEDSINRYMMERIRISVVEALFVHIQDGGDSSGYCRRRLPY